MRRGRVDLRQCEPTLDPILPPVDAVVDRAPGSGKMTNADADGHQIAGPVGRVIAVVYAIALGPVGLRAYRDLIHTTSVTSHTMNDMDGTQVKVSRNGQVSVPAAVRHRWGTSTVLIIDRGDYAIVRPVPDDPIAALRGAYAAPGPATDAARAADRAADAASDDRRQGPAG